MFFKALMHSIALQLPLALALLTCKVTTADKSSEPTRKQALRGLQTYYFNLRLYWRPGYRWQESSSEKKFCLHCRSNSCSRGSGVKVMKCNRNDSRQHFFFSDGRIRSRKNTAACLQREGRSIYLRSCSSSRSQRWNTLRKDGPFPLQIPGSTEKCASQHHHPRDGEKVYMTSCKKSIASQTDKWIVY